MAATPELISPRSPRVAAARRLARRNFRGKERRFLAEGPQAVREAAAHRGSDGEPTLVELFATVEAAERYADIVGDARDAGARVHLADERRHRRHLADRHPAGPRRGLPVPGHARSRTILAARPTAGRRPRARTRPRERRHRAALRRRRGRRRRRPHRRLRGPLQPQGRTGLRRLPLPSAGGRRRARRGGRAGAAGRRRARSWPPTARATDDLDDELDAGTMGGPTAWVFGNEAWGLPEETRALADAVVRVPIHGRAESLNLATAAAVCLYASARAQRAVPLTPRRRSRIRASGAAPGCRSTASPSRVTDSGAHCAGPRGGVRGWLSARAGR